MKKFLERYFNFIKKFIPSESEATSLGLDIASNECKLIEVKRNGNNFKLMRVDSKPIRRDNQAQTLKEILGGIDLSHASLQTAVNGKGTLIRYIEMPRMSLEDLKNSFALEADKYFPFAQDQIYTDCYILDPQGKTKQMDVMATAATKDLIDARIKMMNDCGAPVDVISINAVALANVINVLGDKNVQEELQEKGKNVYAIVDVGESVSNVTIMDDKVSKFSRDIFIGGKDIVKRVCNSLGVDVDRAVSLIKDPGDQRKELAEVCDSILQSITQEIRLSFDYFSTEKNKEISRVLLTGDISKFPGVKESLSEHLEIPVEWWNPFETCEYSDSVNKEEVSQNAHRLTVALGLALLSDA